MPLGDYGFRYLLSSILGQQGQLPPQIVLDEQGRPVFRAGVLDTMDVFAQPSPLGETAGLPDFLWRSTRPLPPIAPSLPPYPGIPGVVLPPDGGVLRTPSGGKRARFLKALFDALPDAISIFLQSRANPGDVRAGQALAALLRERRERAETEREREFQRELLRESYREKERQRLLGEQAEIAREEREERRALAREEREYARRKDFEQLRLQNEKDMTEFQFEFEKRRKELDFEYDEKKALFAQAADEKDAIARYYVQLTMSGVASDKAASIARKFVRGIPLLPDEEAELRRATAALQKASTRGGGSSRDSKWLDKITESAFKEIDQIPMIYGKDIPTPANKPELAGQPVIMPSASGAPTVVTRPPSLEERMDFARRTRDWAQVLLKPELEEERRRMQQQVNVIGEIEEAKRDIEQQLQRGVSPFELKKRIEQVYSSEADRPIRDALLQFLSVVFLPNKKPKK
ncbi:MAG: hypothetical protein QW838_02890 [Candidatus Nitrosotenuis sp.]